MGRCTSLIGQKEGRGRRDLIKCRICYASVEMKGGGGWRSVNEVERIEEGEKSGGGAC